MTDTKISNKKLREFGLVFSLFFPLLIGFIIPKIYGHNYREWALWVGLIFLILGLTSPKTLYLPYQLWIKLGNTLGYINSKVIFGIIFYLLVTPIGLIMRIFKYDPLKLKFNIKNKSYKVYNKNNNIDLTRIF